MRGSKTVTWEVGEGVRRDDRFDSGVRMVKVNRCGVDHTDDEGVGMKDETVGRRR